MTHQDSFNGAAAIQGFMAERKKLGRPFTEIICPTSIANLTQSLSFKMGDEVNTVFIQKEDVFVELGSPQHESVSYIVIGSLSEIHDGRITLIGPDIPDSAGKELNFGQVLLIGGSSIPDLEYKEMERSLFHLQNLEGFMIRAIPNKLWARVNRQVVQHGFSFETLGKALMIMYRRQFKSIQTMEIIFLTTDVPQDFLELRVIGSEVRKKYLKTYSDSLKTRLAELTEKQRADCDNPWSCEECDYNEVCDEIQDIVDKMKVYRARKEASK
ncbi:MAG: hypothetical protein LUQ65_15240 [Candidatus Helarchaeota archaeon]|nr:hypothetical protein [Candidatus Helarchaeota archaeon]